MLVDSAFGALPDQAKGPRRRVQSNAQMLLRLTTDLLDLSHLQANRFIFDLENVDLATACTEATELFSRELRGKPVELVSEVAAGTTVYADSDRLRQVLANLLGNAIKFTPQGYVRIHAAADGNQAVRIEVSDTGVGIPPTEREVIFEPFRRGERAAGISGVGIGLALTRQLTEAMNGTITVESTTGIGSTFVVRLPAPPQEKR